MKQLELFVLTSDDDLQSENELEREADLEAWYEVIMENEREWEEGLQIWFEVMEENGCEMFSLTERENQEYADLEIKRYRQRDKKFREEVYELMDQEE